MEGDNPTSTIEIQTPPKQPTRRPQPSKPKSLPLSTPVKPTPKKPLITKPTPVKPKPPIKPKLPSKPSISSLPIGEPKKLIFTKWWIWIIIGIILFGAIIGIVLLTKDNPLTPTGDNQSFADIEPKIFMCDEIVQMNKERIDNSCEEEAIFKVNESINYILTVYVGSTENSCINGPTELINYVNITCGEKSAKTLTPPR